MDESQLQPNPQEMPIDSHPGDGASPPEEDQPEGLGESEQAEREWYKGSRILSLLFDTHGPAWKYIIRAGLIGFIPSAVIAILLSVATGGSGEGMPKFSGEAGPIVVFVSLVIVSPVVETVVLGFVLWVLSFLTKKPLRQAVISSVLWGVLHSLAASLWGLAVVWPFFVFSCACLAWRRRSWWHAMGVTCGIHVFQNLLPGILISLA